MINKSEFLVAKHHHCFIFGSRIMPLAFDGVRREIKQWAAEMVVKEALRIGMNELLAASDAPTNH